MWNVKSGVWSRVTLWHNLKSHLKLYVQRKVIRNNSKEKSNSLWSFVLCDVILVLDWLVGEVDL